MAEPKRIVILGASYAGLSVTHHLLKHVVPSLPSSTPCKVTLISPSSQTFLRPASPRALISDDFFDQRKLFIDTAAQLEKYPREHWEFVQGRVESVENTTREIEVELTTGASQVLKYDLLVIATGASTPSPLLGLNGTSEDLRAAWVEFRKALPSAKRIVIAGGGPAGVEVAGELGDYLNGSKKGWLSFGSAGGKNKVEITLVTSGKQILPALRSSIASTAEGYLADLGVKIIKDVRVDNIAPDAAGQNMQNLSSPTQIHLSDGTVLEADVYIPATGARPNTSFLPHDVLNDKGAVQTTKGTFRAEHKGWQNVYAVGDCSDAFTPAIHNILAAVPVLSSIIHHDILASSDATAATKVEAKAFKEDTRETQLVPIGRNKGVGAAMGWRMPSWVIWAIKGRDYWMWTTGKLWSGKQWD